MESIPPKKTIGASSLSWRCLTAHTRGQNDALRQYSWLTTTQDNGRVLLLHTSTKERQLAGDLLVRNIMHKADPRKQTEEQVFRCDKVYRAEGCGRCNSTSATIWTTSGETVNCDRSVVCTRVGPQFGLI